MEDFSFQSVFEWILDELSPLWTTSLGSEFHHGVRIGALLMLLTLLVVWLVLLLRRFFRQRCREVKQKGERGTLTIAASAVADAVEKLLEDFEGLEVTSCRLYRRRSKLALVIRCRWELAADELTSRIEEARTRVFEMLRATFGLEQITQVDFRLSGVSGKGCPLPPPTETVTPPEV